MRRASSRQPCGGAGRHADSRLRGDDLEGASEYTRMRVPTSVRAGVRAWVVVCVSRPYKVPA
eukprot:1153060-Lingulodinium_polyedra.AAC.1